jgi:NAD(P)-dependent dehydrogenase (short-subunit alcohol dehydrogenase family)
MNLENKTLLITGANGGLGRALVRYALSHGASKVYCCARDTAKLEALSDLGAGVELCPLDITDKAQIATFAQTIGSIDILINNAGVNSGKRVFDESTDDFEVNVQGTLNVCRGLRSKISKGGSIVNISSILAHVNLPIMGLYCASKSALHSLTQAMRAELSLHQIEVYEVFPGPIDTDMSKDQPMEKASPETIADALFEGIEEKTYEIYPDPFAQGIKEALESDGKALELNFAASVQG